MRFFNTQNAVIGAIELGQWIGGEIAKSVEGAQTAPPQSLPDAEDEVPELEYPGDDPTVAPDGRITPK